MKKYRLKKYGMLWTCRELGKIILLPFALGIIWCCMFMIGGC